MKCIRHSISVSSSHTPSARLKFWHNQLVIQCTTTYLSKTLHRAQQGTEMPCQAYWGKNPARCLHRSPVQCNKQQIHIATRCWDMHRNEAGRLLHTGPAACRTSQTWKRLTTEANKRCHSSERNWDLQNLAWGKKLKIRRTPSENTNLQQQGMALELPETTGLLQSRYQQIQKSFCKTASSIICIQRNKYQIRMLTRPSLTRQHKASKCGKCSI